MNNQTKKIVILVFISILLLLSNCNKQSIQSSKKKIEEGLKINGDKQVTLIKDSLMNNDMVPDSLYKQKLELMIKEIKIGQTGYAYLIDTTGVLAIHPQKSFVGKNISEYEFIKTVKKTRSGIMFYDWKGHEKILYYSQLKDSDKIFCLGTYVRELYTNE